MNSIVLKCKNCSIIIFGSKKNKQFCSRKCLNAYKYAILRTVAYVTCAICNIKFSTGYKTKKTCGNIICARLYINKKQVFINRKRRNKTFNKLHLLESDFSKSKNLYNNMLIDYPNSPTGKAFIGFAKQPLMPNSNGVGFQGVKLQSENRFLVQCSGCSNWYKQITYLHLKQCCRLSIREYKEKFGLNRGEGLISDVLGNIRAKHIEKYAAKNSNFYTKNITNLITYRKNYDPKHRVTRTQRLNGTGTCPDQLKKNLVQYIHRFNRLPRCGDRIGRDGLSYSPYIRSFGSFTNALKSYGLPYRKIYTNYFEFPDHTIFRKDENNYMELYYKMVTKCPILTDPKYATP